MTESDAASGSNLVREVEKGVAFEVWQGPTGAMRMDWTRQGVHRMILAGHGYVEYAAPLLRRWDAVLRFTGRATLLVDLWDTPAYDSALRVAMTGWGVKHRTDMDALHVLTSSKIVGMGVSVANLAMGGIVTAYTQRATFAPLAKKFGLPINPVMPT
jgi:hypothetical protein